MVPWKKSFTGERLPLTRWWRSSNFPLRAGTCASTLSFPIDTFACLKTSRPNLSHANPIHVTGLPETILEYRAAPAGNPHRTSIMTTPATILNLPIRTLGLSAQLVDWLIDAGLPTVPLDRSAVRQGIGPSETERPFLLFDSRNASARLDAEAAGDLGYEIIDAARLLVGFRQHDPDAPPSWNSPNPRQRLLEGLREAMEEAGGVWIRLADFPFPYRSAICLETAESREATVITDVQSARWMNACAPVPISMSGAGRLTLNDWLRNCQLAGRPVRASLSEEQIQSRGPVRPTTWMTTVESFHLWWRFRSQLAITAIRDENDMEIELASALDSQSASWRPAIEIWRGRHYAVLPIATGGIRVADDSIPFQLQPHRSPTGFAADDIETGYASPTPAPLITAS